MEEGEEEAQRKRLGRGKFKEAQEELTKAVFGSDEMEETPHPVAAAQENRPAPKARCPTNDRGPTRRMTPRRLRGSTPKMRPANEVIGRPWR